MDSQNAFQLSSVAARFAPTLPEGCSHELAQYLRRRPEHWHAMRPKDLELLVADIFRSNYHDGEVFHVGKPQDRGVDVVFIEANSTKWLVQVKRRENPRLTEQIFELRGLLVRNLERNLGMEPGVLGKEDGTESAAADALTDQVAPDELVLMEHPQVRLKCTTRPGP